MLGVKAVHIMQQPGTEIFWAGYEIVSVAAVDEGTAEDALRAIKVEYKVLPHFVSDAEPPKTVGTDSGPISEDDFQDMEENQVPDEEVIAAIQKRGISFKPSEKDYASMKGMGVEAPIIAALRKAKYVESTGKAKSPFKKTALQTQGEPEKAFAAAAAVSEGVYGVPCIVHRAWRRMAPPASGPATRSWWSTSRHKTSLVLLRRWPSRWAFPRATSTCCSKHWRRIRQQVLCRPVGRQYGNPSKKAGGKPVKNMLDRKAEFEVAGMRPSAYARVKIAADKNGKIVAWDSRSWGTGGVGGGGTPPLPYILEIPNQRKQNTAISTNQGSARAWRAPNHPQAAAITMGAVEDLAAEAEDGSAGVDASQPRHRRARAKTLTGKSSLSLKR